MNEQYRKNLKAISLACKNYTDTQIQKSEERILSIVARNNVDFIDHINEPTYRFTAPLNSKLLMLQSIAGNSVKYSPSVASDNNATHIKTLPSTVYDLDVSKVDGVGYKVNQLVETYTYSLTNNFESRNYINDNSQFFNLFANHKYLVITSYDTTKCFGYRLRNSVTGYVGDTLTVNAIIDNITLTSGDYTVQYYIDTQQTIERKLNIFDLTADFGAGNEPTSVSDCYTAYLQRGINIYEYTPQQSSIKNNAFTGATIEGINLYNDNVSAYTKPVNYYVCPINNLIKGQTYKLKATLKGTAMTGVVVGITPYGNEYSEFNLTYCLGTDGELIERTLNVDSSWTSPKLVIYASSTNQIEQIFENYNVMLNKGSTALDYIPYTSQTIPIDLTTIKDSNNVSLFPSGKMMGNSNVADFITPYNQESRWFEEKLKDLNWQKSSSGDNRFYATIPTAYKWEQNVPAIGSNYAYGGTATSSEEYYTNDKTFKLFYTSSSQTPIYEIYAVDTSYNDATAFKNHFGNNDVIQYERATYLTSNTDLTSFIKINAQSNGTITLNNTDNVDMPNLISYNAIIRHSLATAVKQEGANKLYLDNNTTSFAQSYIVSKNGNEYTFKSTGNYGRVGYYINDLIKGNTYTISYKIKKVSGTNITQVRYADNINSFDATYNTYAMVNPTTTFNEVNYTFVATSNVFAFNVYITAASAYGDEIILKDIMLNEGSTALSYKPYKAPITRLLPNSEAKYSWGITDGVRNTRVFCDDECNPVNEGSLVVGNQDLGSLNWDKTSVFYTNINGLKDSAKGLCNKFPVVSFEEVSPNEDFIQTRTNNQIYFRYVSGSIYENMASNIFKSAMNGIPLFFEKKNADTETLDDFDFSFDCEEGDTFTIIGCELLQCYATYSFLIKEAKSNE